jgi:hypothetical protein
MTEENPSHDMIPKDAVRAAKKVAWDRYGSRPDDVYVRALLSAAAPHMLAAAWDAGQDAGAHDQMAVDTSLANGTPEPAQATNPYL